MTNSSNRAREYWSRREPFDEREGGVHPEIKAHLQGSRASLQAVLERAEKVAFSYEDGNGGEETVVFLNELKRIIEEESK